MKEKTDFLSGKNIVATLIPLFFLFVFLKNPSFGDPLLLIAVIGQLLMLTTIVAGIFILAFRKSMNRTNYLAFGILAFVFGISGLISEIVSGFDAWKFYLPFVLCLIIIGVIIIKDVYKTILP